MVSPWQLICKIYTECKGSAKSRLGVCNILQRSLHGDTSKKQKTSKGKISCFATYQPKLKYCVSIWIGCVTLSETESF